MERRDPGIVADARADNWVDRQAPEWLKPYARLARWDRPIGFWLLFWPCGFGLGLAALAGGRDFDVVALALMFAGAVAMRGAGCTFNDIVDTDIDAKVARTRLRPIPSGQVTRRQAAAFLLAQSLVGLAVLVQFDVFTVWIGIASLVLVGIYPFMKRITWWPQAFLGLAFSWGALVSWSSQTGGLGSEALWLYLGCIAWTIGYDTIYALQDVEDDALIGVRSTARLFGRNVKPIVSGFYLATLFAWGIALALSGAGPIGFVGLGVVAGWFVFQIVTLDPRLPENALARFKDNTWVGLTLTVALVVDGLV